MRASDTLGVSPFAIVVFTSYLFRKIPGLLFAEQLSRVLSIYRDNRLAVSSEG